MRAMIFTASVLLACSPVAAMAQDDPDANNAEVLYQDEMSEAAPDAGTGTQADPGMTALAETLSDPLEQQKMAAMVGAVGEVLMQVPVGPLIDAVSRAVPDQAAADMPAIAPDATLRDLAGRDKARLIQAEIADKVPDMMAMLGGLVKGMEAMRPALADMSRQLQSQLSAARRQ